MQGNTEKQVTAQNLNIRAAKAISDTVKSTLGPAGMDKMMVDGGGGVIVTNDGATILQSLDIAHPGAKMIVEAANTQESMCYDGTTSTVVLAGQLLANSDTLFEKGIHPNIICKGYRQASKWATDYLSTLAIDSKKHLAKVAKTAITGKSLEASMEHVSSLCVEAVESSGGNYDKIRVLCQPGGGLDDSYCFKGVVLHKEFMLPNMTPNPNGAAVLINTGMTVEKMDENMQVQFSSAKEFQSYKKQSSRDVWVTKAELITNHLPDGGVVFSRESVNEALAALLARKQISVVHRIPESDMTALSHLLRASVSHSPEDIMEVGSGSIKQEVIGDMRYVIVEGEADVTTLVLRGATRQTLDETERGFEDALGVVSIAHQTGEVVTGGGSTFIAMSQHLRTRAAEIGGRQQMAIEAFADSLEVIPATIAENAGHDPLDTILALRNEHVQGNGHMGPDVETGGTCNMSDLGVFEPLHLIKQCVQSASEVTISILRIDDIVSKKGNEPVE
tara:strand:+ start:1701 stop:3212 length:1512 start_codon:yes stop_codon:yes gene_type:complete